MFCWNSVAFVRIAGFYDLHELGFIAERGENPAVRLIELAEELNVLEPQGMYESPEDVDCQAEDIADDEKDEGQDPAHVGNPFRDHLRQKVDDQPYSRSGKPEGQ